MTLTPSLNRQIIEFGTEVFADLADRETSLLSPRAINDLLMQWSMRQKEFKLNLFRLVDVLPTLSTHHEIAEHVEQYLVPPANAIHPALGWLVGLGNTPTTSRLTSLLVRLGVRQMAKMFIAGESPQSALSVLRRLRANQFAFTVDLLGEFCVCEDEAREYQRRYIDALETLSKTQTTWAGTTPLVLNHPGEMSPLCISVKLSALYSQTGVLNFERSVEVLSERLAEIARRAHAAGALMYVDAEDSGNNSIIYESFKRVFGSPEFRTMPYPGIVIQAYAKGSEARVREMLAFAHDRGSPIAIRLVKGAYWDFERVVSAQNHWEFPLWGHKESSDAHFEHLSRLLIDNHTVCMPAFGSHNIRSLSHACCYAKHKGLSPSDFEIQVLYGMAEPIAEAFKSRGYLVRMYIPLGKLLPGMGYLVRRLLENTSNESFLKHTFFDADEVSSLLREPHIHPEESPIPSPIEEAPIAPPHQSTHP